MDRTSLSCAWLEAPHKQNYDQGGSPQAELHTTREAPHKQNYDQGAYPQAELRPGSWLAGWLAGWLAELYTTREPVKRLAACLAGWGLVGWLAEAQRGLEGPREAERG